MINSLNMIVPFYVLFAFTQVHMSMSVMLNHMTRWKYFPWNIIYFINCLTLTVVLCLEYFTNYANKTFTELVLTILLISTILQQAHFIVGMCFEITNVLGIRVFKVKPVSFVFELSYILFKK